MVMQASVMSIGCACSMTATATTVMGRRASGPRLARLAGSLSSRSETAGISPKTHLAVASQRRGDRDADDRSASRRKISGNRQAPSIVACNRPSQTLRSSRLGAAYGLINRQRCRNSADGPPSFPKRNSGSGYRKSLTSRSSKNSLVFPIRVSMITLDSSVGGDVSRIVIADSVLKLRCGGIGPRSI
jgi:hypothetical protein